jgi:hypothetical protein
MPDGDQQDGSIVTVILGGERFLYGFYGIGGIVLGTSMEWDGSTLDVPFSAQVSVLDLSIKIEHSSHYGWSQGWSGYAGIGDIGGIVSGTTVFAGFGYSQISGSGTP